MRGGQRPGAGRKAPDTRDASVHLVKVTPETYRILRELRALGFIGTKVTEIAVRAFYEKIKSQNL